MNADEIRNARQQAGLTSTQAAVRLGVNVDTFRSWEAGRRRPKPEMWPAIRAMAAGEPLPSDEIAGLREIVSQLTERVSDLAAMVIRLDGEVARLSER